MKSIKTNDKCESSFPKLVETSRGTVYLLTSERVGTVVFSGRGSAMSLGEHKAYIRCALKPYKGSVCLGEAT